MDSNVHLFFFLSVLPTLGFRWQNELWIYVTNSMTSTAPASVTGCYSLRFPLSDYVSTWLLIPASSSFRTCCSSSTQCTGFSLLAGAVAACLTWVVGLHVKRVYPKSSVLVTLDSPQFTVPSKMKPLSCIKGKGKGKAVPLQAWRGPEGSRKLRFPNFVTTAQDGGKVVSLTYRPPLPPGNSPGTHFC